MTNVIRKIQSDQSSPVEIVTTFVKSQYNASQYKTKLDPVVLMTPHSDGVAGKDIVVIAKDQNFGPTFISNYNTALRDISVFTKDQLSLSMPVQIQIASGNNLNPPGSPGNPTTEPNKINTTNLIGSSINTIASGLSINNMTIKWYIVCPKDPGLTLSGSSMGDSPYGVGSTLDTATGRHIIVDFINNWLHIVYTQKNAGTGFNQVWHAYSQDGGKTWFSELISGSSSYDQYQPQIVMTTDGTLHFAWVETYSIDETPPSLPAGTYWFGIIYYRNKSSSGTWSGITQLSYAGGAYPYRPGFQIHPSLQVKNDGLSIGVAWAGCNCFPSSYPSTNIVYNERDINGTWGTLQNVVSLSAKDGYSVSLDYDLSGYSHICYVKNALWSQANHATNSSGSWVAESLTTDGTNCLNASNCVIDLAGTIHWLVVVGDTSPASIYYWKKVLGGSWISTKLTTSANYIRVGLQVDTSRNLYVYGSQYNAASHYDGWMAIYTYDLVKTSERLFSADSRDVIAVSVPWSRLPLSNSVYQTLSQQGNAIVFVRASNVGWTLGDIVFTADSNSVIGSVPIIPSYDSYNTKLRGVISKSKLNPPLICPAVIQ